MDIILFLLWAIYCMITAVAMAMTLREYLGSGRGQFRWVLVGLLACLVWPLMVVVAVFSARRHPGGPPPEGRLESERI